MFAGNLELNITDEEMRRIFGRYGRLVDIDVKRPAPGTGNAYAFIRYENLDQALIFILLLNVVNWPPSDCCDDEVPTGSELERWWWW